MGKLAGQYPDIHRIFLGKGQYFNNDKEQTQQIENITFAGLIDNDGDYISCLYLLVYPLVNAGFGSISLYIMAQAVPIIASAVGAMPDNFKNTKKTLQLPIKNS